MNMIKFPIRDHIAQPAILGLLAVLLLSGCATNLPRGDPGLLNFLSDGKTTRAEAIIALGEPSGQFEKGTILTFRMGYDERTDGYFPVMRETSNSGWPTWEQCKYSLVLVFDDAGVLRRHALVKVNK